MTPAIKILRSLIREIVRGDTSLSLLREGGNALVGGITSVVPYHLLDINVANVRKLIGLDGLKHQTVGNTEKKFFSDIDIAIDENELSDFLNTKLNRGDVTAKNLFYVKGETAPLKQYLDSISEKVKDKDETFKIKINPMLRTFNVLAPLVGVNSQPTDRYSINPPHEQVIGYPGKIQVDFLVGNLGWMGNTNKGAPKDSKFKAAHRNQLIDSIMRSIPEEKIELSLSKEEMETVPEGVMLKKRVEFDRRAGVVKKIYYEEPVYLKSGKLSDHPKEIVLKTEIDSDPNNITSYFLKNPVPWSDMLSYEKALAQLNSDNFKYPEIKERVIKHYEDYLDKYPNSFKIVTSH